MKTGVDANGFIQSLEIVPFQMEFEGILNDSLRHVNSEFDARELHSVYVYGSVACGRARLGTSDLDLLLVFKTPDAERNRQLKDIEERLSVCHGDTVRDAGLAAATLDEIFSGTNQTGWGCFLKHMCRNLQGPDLGRLFGPFRPSKSVVFGLNDDLLQQTRAFFDRKSHEQKSRIALSRKLIRASIGLCLELEQHPFWSTDLQECVNTFALHYPAQSEQMKQLLLIATGYETGQAEAIASLKQFAAWFGPRFEEQIMPYACPDKLVEQP